LDVVPSRKLDSVLVLNIALHIILGGGLLQVVMYLLGCSVIIRPLQVRRERIGVVVSRDVALAAGISVDCSLVTITYPRADLV